LADTHTRHGGERVGQRKVAALLDDLAVDHRHAGWDVEYRCRNARGGYDEFGDLHDIGGKRGAWRHGGRHYPAERTTRFAGGGGAWPWRGCRRQQEAAHKRPIVAGTTARPRVPPRRFGTPRPRHASSLDAGRSPGSRVLAASAFSPKRSDRGNGIVET